MRHAGKLILTIILCAIFFPAMGFAASILVNWNANTESDLAGYIVYYGVQSGVYSAAVDVNKVTSYQINNATTGATYYIALSAYDTSGNESNLSTEASIYVPTTVPPTTPTVTTLSPAKGAVVSTNPYFTWKGTGIAKYRVAISLDNRNYYAIYSGTGTSCRMSSTTWSSYIRSGATVYWYVLGTTSSGQVYKSSVTYFKKG